MKLSKKLLGITVLGAATVLASCSGSFKTVDQIKTAGKITVGTNAEFAPFEFKEGADFKGIDMDIIKAYAESLGVTCEVKDQEFDAALISVSTYKVDVAMAAITKNEKREKTMDFTNSYYTANQVVIVKADSELKDLATEDEILTALNGKKIGVQRGTTGQYYVEGDADWDFSGITNANCVTYDNGAMASQALANGQVDAVIIDAAPASIYVKNQTGLKVLDVVLTEEEYAIAVAKGNTSLVESLNAFIAKIKADGSFDTIVAKYYAE